MAKRCRELTFSLLLPVYAIVIIVLAAIFAGLLIFSYTVWRKRQRRRAYITSAIDQVCAVTSCVVSFFACFCFVFFARKTVRSGWTRNIMSDAVPAAVGR